MKIHDISKDYFYSFNLCLYHYFQPKKDCEHSYSQENQKKRNTGSKKLGCTAAVYMREIVFFPEYKVM